jgi:hypothetical protein
MQDTKITCPCCQKTKRDPKFHFPWTSSSHASVTHDCCWDFLMWQILGVSITCSEAFRAKRRKNGFGTLPSIIKTVDESTWLHSIVESLMPRGWIIQHVSGFPTSDVHIQYDKEQEMSYCAKEETQFLVTSFLDTFCLSVQF